MTKDEVYKLGQTLFTAVAVGVVSFLMAWSRTDNVKELMLAAIPPALTVCMSVYGIGGVHLPTPPARR